MADSALQPIPGRLCGRIQPKSRPKALRLGEYVNPAAVSLPPATNRRAAALDSIKRQFLNDTYGCCVFSSKGHGLGLVSAALTGTPVVPTDAEIYAAYRHFVPWGKGGANMTAVLDYYQATGFKFGGKVRKLDGYVAANYTNPDMIRVGLTLFGVGYAGLNLTNDWYQSAAGDTWDLTNSGIVGGHEVCFLDYDPTGVTLATWGHTNTVTWRELASGHHFDELYFPLHPEWYNDQKIAVSGLDVDTLRADLAKIGAGTLPPIVSVAPGIDFSQLDA